MDRSYAAREQVADFAGSLNNSQLLCRELGHNWKGWTAEWRDDERCYVRGLRCPRCGNERWQWLSVSGAILADRRKYVDGYLSKGIGRIVGEGRDALRLESLIRTLDKKEN